MPFFLSAIGNEQQFNANGSPLSGGKINTYAAGTTTRVATYTDKAGATEQANPIILNTLGLPANPIWLKGGVSYKFVITDSADVVQRTIDDITGTNDPAVASSVDQWVLFTAVPTFISATSFSLAGDQTSTFQVGRRVKSANTGGTGYHTITASTFASSITTVTVTNDSVVLDTGLSAVSYGLLSALSNSLPNVNYEAASVNGVKALHLNDIINGNFPIAQAGTSFAAPVSGAYDLDGWLNSNTTTVAFDVAQVAGSTAGRLARRVTITTAKATVAAGDVVSDQTRIEGYNIEKYVGQTFTVAFRAKVPVAGIHCVTLRNAGDDRSYVKEINFPTANSWQDCAFTVVGGLPTAGTWNYTNGVGLSVSFTHMSGTTFQTTPDAWRTGNFIATANQVNDCATVGNVWALEKVTMNLGTVAAVSEIDVGDEQVRCQRYARPWGRSAKGIWLSATECRLAEQLGIGMRATPTAALTTTAPVVEDWNTSGLTAANAAISGSRLHPAAIDVTINGFTGAPGARAPAYMMENYLFLSSRL